MCSTASTDQFSAWEKKSPVDVLTSFANAFGSDLSSPDFAEEMDNRDPLRHFRDEFSFPTHQTSPGGSKDIVYLCGHSLGLKPKRCDQYVQRALAGWSEKGVNCHFEGFLPAVLCETLIQDDMAYLVGAKPSEVAILNGLTVNLHLMLSAFYRPTSDRFKIMIEEYAFSSDMYAVKSQIALKGYSLESALVTFKPREGEHCLRHEDMLEVIAKEGVHTALILLPGVQFLTGQKLNLPSLIEAGRKQGCVVGLDLAHSVGNVRVRLHDWGADFAVWCNYKYLNSGPGSLGALWVHERHCQSSPSPEHLQGWFGNKLESRFHMDPDFEPDEGAARFKLSNTSPVMVAMVKASLDIFREAGVENLWRKQFLLTGYLEYLLKEHLKEMGNLMRIVTPSDPDERGCQLSLYFDRDLSEISETLRENNIEVDIRKKHTIRAAPVPLYNSFQDVLTFVTVLKKSLSQTNEVNQVQC